MGRKYLTTGHTTLPGDKTMGDGDDDDCRGFDALESLEHDGTVLDWLEALELWANQ